MSDAPSGPTSPVRVGFDATSLLEPLTGVGTVADALLRGLAARSDVEVHAFAVSWRGRGRLADAVPAGATVHGRPLPARLARMAWAHADHPTVGALVGRVDVVHGPNFVVPPGGRAAEVVTVHDLTALRFPEMCTPDVLEWPGLLRRALRRGAWVHAVSASVADEVREAFPEAGERVVAVPNGLAPPLPEGPATDAAAGRALAGAERYVLALGTVEPRKDLPTLVAAFDALAAADASLRLVVAGADGLAADELAAAVAAAAHGDRVVRRGRVDDHQRAALLRGASVLAYPSRYEGFGLVPLEAMAVGTPVVATRVGAIAEVAGEAALLVPERDRDALADALHAVLHDPLIAERLIDDGTSRAAAFTWDAAVDGVVELYRRAVDAR
ncbi:MAG: glycosyltransferase family 4 protein [Acidimicrobiales bacterium]|nr:glycosyltransferase family 4 protein [Acidimicrobiales bacterium]HRW36320.1 glycosyltransferase family 1 protein [Aquihabitans sp.]